MNGRWQAWLCGAFVLACAGALASSQAAACPFCVARGPTLAQRIDAADEALLAELVARTEREATFRPLRWLKRSTEPGVANESAERSLPVALPDQARGLFLLLGEPGEPTSTEDKAPSPAHPQLRWQATPIEETGYAYLAKLPPARQPAAERLRYAARFLEHADPLVAADAYLEFGHAPFDEVRQAADAFSQEKLRRWLVDPGVPGDRKGFYALALGLAQAPAERKANAALLSKLIAAPADDFRAGFDGVLAASLLLSGEQGLAKIEERILANPKSRDGDVRHSLSALRFYHDYGREIPPERLAQALHPLLDRPEFAAAAIVDLARWQDWSQLGRVAGLYQKPKFDTPAVQEAVVGYLLVCPEPAAAAALAELRASDPQGVAAAEAGAARFGGVK
ncbi:MAG: hypothetical protein U0836_21745 [Pirellulales bacterium]